MKITQQQKSAAQSYLRSVVAAVVAVAATGNYAPDYLGKAALAALIPPILRWANSNDPEFGRNSKFSETTS